MVRTIYASAARTATPTAVTVNTGRHKAIQLVIDVTAVTATPSVVPVIAGVDSLSGKDYALLTGAAMTESGSPYTRVLTVGPALPVTSNVSANAPLPDYIKITFTHADSDSITYSAALHLID